MSGELILSLNDLVKEIRKNKTAILLSGVIVMVLSFFYLLFQPIRFTAKGIFKSQPSQNIASNNLFTTLKLFEGSESYSPKDTPRTFLTSYPVLEQVVLDLNLQAAIEGNKRSHKFQELWYTLKTAIFLQRLKRERPYSQILTPNLYVSDKAIIPEILPELICTDVDFSSQTSHYFSIQWTSATTYKVLHRNKIVGWGESDQPFYWEKGYFTLSGHPKMGKVYRLHLIPLEEAVMSLQNSIKLTKDKEHASLIHISYSHRDRHLAMSIVNSAMEQFENYLKAEGKKKITKQLSYLQQRQNETVDQLEKILEKHKTYLDTHLDAGAILSLEKELEFMAARQAHHRNQLHDLQMEIEYLSQNHVNTLLSFSAICEHWQKERKQQTLQALSINGARNLLQSRQNDLDLLYFNNERYEECLIKLKEEHFDGASLSKLIDDDLCRQRFEKINTLHHRLIDSKNWSHKESEQLKAELDVEKQFLIQHLSHLKEGLLLQEKALKGRIHSLEKNLIYLLLDNYNQVGNSLERLSEAAGSFPQRWLNQQKIDFNTKLYSEMMESITKMIESKNIGYNLDYLLASSFKQATASLLPNCPPLFLGAFLGGLIGMVLALIALVIYVIWQGPSGSLSHLVAQGRQVIEAKDRIAQMGVDLSNSGPIILIASQGSLFFISSLLNWLSKKGEKVFVIDFSSTIPPSFMVGEEKIPFMVSQRFQQLLADLAKSYDRILILSHASIESIELKILCSKADGTIYGVTGERLVQLLSLPKNTFFLALNSNNRKLFTLNHIRPTLDKMIKQMKGSSFSSSESVWHRVFVKKP